jgi:hypothetical protein
MRQPCVAMDLRPIARAKGIDFDILRIPEPISDLTTPIADFLTKNADFDGVFLCQ